MELITMFKDGGWAMWPILACLIFGIIASLQRFWRLSRASIDTHKFIESINDVLTQGDISAAREFCVKSRGPVASIFHAGLLRTHRGVVHVEKAIINAGSIEMAALEKGSTSLTTIISTAPMLGFLGTVWGMIEAFHEIQLRNDISPSIVAGGISTALLTTLFGLVVAIFIQMANNYFTSRVDTLIVDMEESSMDLVETLVEMEKSPNSL